MKRIILLLTATIIFTSCSKSFLNNTPEDFLTAANFYKTESDFQQALVAAYASVRSAGDINAWVIGEMRSDNTHYDIDRGASASIAITARLEVADFLDDDGNQVTNEKYNNSYVGISRVNVILDRITDIQMDQAKKDQIIAEARFLRAFLYFELVRYYGGVPLPLHEVKNAAEAQLQRSTADEVYAQIIDDAIAAAAVLPPKAKELGRTSKAAAKVLLAYVYLTRNKYAEAEAVLKEVTGYGYSLLSDYRSIFNPANKTNNELIFEAQYKDGANGMPSNFIYYFAPQTPDVYPVTGFHLNNRGTGGLNVPTPGMLACYKEGDTRFDASVAIAEGTGAAGSFVIDVIKSPVGYSAPPGKIGRPFIRKYDWPHSVVSQTNSNWPVYRYADVLLLLAEALNEQSKSTEALTYLNQVRHRAFAGGGTITVTDKSALRDIIAQERRVELAFENKRWPDLVRTGKAIEIMTADGIKMKELDAGLNPNAYKVTDWRLLFPIPRREIQIANLTQNPGY